MMAVVADTVVVGIVKAVAANAGVRVVAVGITVELAADAADQCQNIASWAEHHHHNTIVVGELDIAAAILVAGSQRTGPPCEVEAAGLARSATMVAVDWAHRRTPTENSNSPTKSDCFLNAVTQPADQ